MDFAARQKVFSTMLFTAGLKYSQCEKAKRANEISGF
jgi:hypothetical protein